MTVFCGSNNTGKTYAMYILWSISRIRNNLSQVPDFAEKLAIELKSQGAIRLSVNEVLSKYLNELQDAISISATQHLPELFSAPVRFFSNASVEIAIDPDSDKRNIIDSEIQASGNFGLEGNRFFTFQSQINSEDITITLINNEIASKLVADFIARIFSDYLLGDKNKNSFLLPAERGGLNIFYSDLDTANSRVMKIIRSAKREKLDQKKLLDELVLSEYSEPIQAYIEFLRKLRKLEKGATNYHEIAKYLQLEIAQVSYQVDDSGKVTARPNTSEIDIGIHQASSTVKNCFGLWAYLETIAKPGDCLMIDEPELNLHPDNQRFIARLLTRLVNHGIRVVISTHSDYIVREINNMIMLGNNFTGRDALEQSWGYDENGEERLRVEQVAAYHFEENQVLKIPISPEFGIEVSSMDAAINRMNQSNSAIYFALQDTLHPVVVAQSIEDGSV